jgi:hypothetical protein
MASLADASFSLGTTAADTELVLQKVVWVIVGGHSITAALAAKLANERGASWFVPALKVTS